MKPLTQKILEKGERKYYIILGNITEYYVKQTKELPSQKQAAPTGSVKTLNNNSQN